ncbi:ThuA domain-containing protein [Seonamhaeicola algicola]|uniref:ThuA domain-containing protein n=1 Tax=Seonamhaeicola algicola TaxID=1719036 RepID=A0A5C7AW20_9FLAO|nr:ThuA domain-containing protein [Seonamhaeicola algicola]TXE11779.1 ThuA domain-containing protein [Seonamhaeicola algicola]
MKFKRLFLLILLVTISTACNAVHKKKIKVLIIDGQNNHAVWPKSTIMMRQYLEETGLFKVDIERTKFLWKSTREAKYLPLANAGEGVETEKAKTDPDFIPNFSKYDVVISNFGWRTAPWPEETKKAFESYLKNGGGFVTVHAADNCFPEWKEYNKAIGIGGWDRNKKHGPYLYVNEVGKVVKDTVSDGYGGAHGKAEEFLVSMYNTKHPITKGIPKTWMHAFDECYALLRGPAENVTILGTAVSSKSNRAEPMLMTINYHKGRVFHTTLGHDTKAFECVGFITTLLRGTEWAATGKVTIGIPEDFPTANKVSTRAFNLKQ